MLGCTQSLPQETRTLAQARQGFQTRLVSAGAHPEPLDVPPSGLFYTVKYPAPGGGLAAYLSPDPGDGKRHPAIVWITGGDCNSIGDVWSPAPRDNDQTASAYRQAGLVMMFPSLRGGNQNSGTKEGFFGEVDDVIAATEFLKKQPYVDPNRIYLGGHSTGGTLVLLVAECSNLYRAVFSFGPVADVSHYGEDSGFLPFNVSDSQEVKLRSPGYWLSSISTPVWVFEGTGQGNIQEVRAMARASTNSKVHFLEVSGETHFSCLAPTNALIAQKLLQDTGDTSTLAFTQDEVNHH